MDYTATIWDAKSGVALIEPLKLYSGVSSARFSPDGRMVVTACKDSTARVWDAQSGQPLTDPLSHGDVVGNAEFSADGRRILTTSAEQVARIWDVAPAGTQYPDWLLPLAEAISGQVVNQQNILQPTKLDRAEVIQTVREAVNQSTNTDDWVAWGRWFLADPAIRPISPFCKITVAKQP
jgi:WD40 repeat protein